MTWIKLNDNAPQHPKVATLSDRAFRVWIQSLCYSAQYLTDGILPSSFLAQVPRRTYEELVASGLWIAGQSVVVIHDYLKHQTSKAKIDAERERNARRRTAGEPRGKRTGVPEKNRDQKTEVQRSEGTPQPPADAGGVRIRREHLKQAEAILRSRLGYCKHLPECGSQMECLQVIAQELAQKAKAS